MDSKTTATEQTVEAKIGELEAMIGRARAVHEQYLSEIAHIKTNAEAVGDFLKAITAIALAASEQNQAAEPQVVDRAPRGDRV